MSVVTAREIASRWRQIVIWTAFIALDTATQLAFKWGADGLGDMDFGLAMMAKACTLPGVWLAVLGYVATFVVWMAILRDMPLSRAFPMTGLSYVTVPLVAWLALGERINLTLAFGIALIVVGVVALGQEEPDAEG